jgi:hypothetical protein
MPYTPYPQVNDLLQLLLDGLQTRLPGRLFGLYLYGSLASGDFNPDTSDIDFLGVVQSPLEPPEVAALEALHRQIAGSGNRWAARLEGSYLTLDALPRWDPHDETRWPTLNEGRFYLAPHGPDWVLQRHILHQSDRIVSGPPLQDLILPVSEDQLRQAVRLLLAEWWQPMLADPDFLQRPEYRAYAVLSMGRALHTLHTGTLASKPQAANWVRSNLEDPWPGLAAAALDWQPGQPFAGLDPVLDFIRFTCELAAEQQGRIDDRTRRTA